jgi:DNA helicase-2/ATP-dependent DNA helicase PcrA
MVAEGDWSTQDAVNILTVHSSKGLEFPVVFLVNLVNERFPGRNRSEQISIPDELIKEELPTGDFHQEEERRLFYVGMTRAKEKLYFTTSDDKAQGLDRGPPFRDRHWSLAVTPVLHLQV